MVTCCHSEIRLYLPFHPFNYSVIEAMPLEEQQNPSNLEEIISPFLTETGETSEEEASVICRQIAVAFGSSGKSTDGSTVFQAVESLPGLLNTAVRIIDNSEETGLILNPNATYGKVLIGGVQGNITGSNSTYDVKAMPTTIREARRMKRTSEQMAELLEKEKAKHTMARQEVINARMKVSLSSHYLIISVIECTSSTRE